MRPPPTSSFQDSDLPPVDGARIRLSDGSFRMDRSSPSSVSCERARPPSDGDETDDETRARRNRDRQREREKAKQQKQHAQQKKKGGRKRR